MTPKKLPPSLDIGTLLGRSLPADVTLREAIASFALLPAVQELQDKVTRKLRVRFLDRDGREYPGDMTIGELRKLAKLGKLVIVIDDGEGGVPARAPA